LVQNRRRAIIIDFEAAVAAANKELARHAVRRPGALRADTEAVSRLPFAGIVLPKSETPAEIAMLG
jgi:citrate lyase beta subunit